MHPNSTIIDFTSETSSNGVVERRFVLDEITGVLFSPTTGNIGSPLVLSGHSGGMHKKAPGLVASALHSVSMFGFTVAAIDAPGHGDRPRNRRDRQRADAVRQARSAGEPIAPIVVDYTTSLAKRAVPEWQTTLDALQALPVIGPDRPVGYAGVSLGVVTGVALAAVEPRIAALSFGGVFVDDVLIDAARKVTAPVEYRIPWNDEELDRQSAIDLFDAFGSEEKTLHAYTGRRYPVPDYELDSAARFFVRHLRPTSGATPK
ncbi:pimeloyl-ACP methyl ester carboxylesterase [Rhodococcus sp. 27YEA15]|uniref:alpha/beta hydrolase n=1 Tax=Rhodococcus sp. 27YEA15 TaxID=3156259 RepID=UPI003C79A9B6